MKVVHCVGWYPPGSFGGTERYVDGLAKSLHERGTDVVVMAARDGLDIQRYEYQGYPVVRYPVPPRRSRKQLQGLEAHDSFDLFRRLLAEQRADIYHQHSWSLGCGLHHLRAARDLGIPAILTVHVPANICPNGTMMRGETPCDGRLDTSRCSACLLAGKGVPAASIAPIAGMPRTFSAAASRIPGRVGTLLGTCDRVARHVDELLEACQLAEQVVVVAEWLRKALLINGVPPGKIVLCRHGVDCAEHGPRPPRVAGPLRIGFLGRWDRVKGIDTIVAAVHALPDTTEVELLIHALTQGDEGAAYQREVAALANGDPRIHFLPPLPPEQVSEFLRRIDVLAVPSRGLETGPLVALEALAAGTPVLGSALGGLKEWIVDGVNGWLVPHWKVEAWKETIQRLASGDASSAPAIFTRQMGDVADEMSNVYMQALRKERRHET